jgi:Effector Associated Constant Component 1
MATVTLLFESDLEASDFLEDWVEGEGAVPARNTMGPSAQEVVLVVAVGRGLTTIARSLEAYLKAKRTQIKVKNSSGLAIHIDSTMGPKQIAEILDSTLKASREETGKEVD